MDFIEKIKRLFSKPEDQYYMSQDEGLEYVSGYARGLVRSGYNSREDIIYYVADAISSEGVKNIKAKSLVAEEINKLTEEQATWPDQTDYDKLNAAMTNLERAGVVARENFSCCGSCASVEIWDEIKEYNQAGLVAEGYVFFHEQAVEHVVEGGQINFWYGSAVTEASEEDCVAIGQRLVDELRGQGLSVDWNGKLSMCVMVDVDFKRPWVET